MALRSLTTLSVFCLAFCLFVPSARAQEGCGEHCIQNPEDGFNGWLEPETGFNAPSPGNCTARHSLNQACHICTFHDADLSGPAHWSCDWTTTTQYCRCGTCSATNPGDGVCSYYGGW
jgi:hypothetical protein